MTQLFQNIRMYGNANLMYNMNDMYHVTIAFNELILLEQFDIVDYIQCIMKIIRTHIMLEMVKVRE